MNQLLFVDDDQDLIHLAKIYFSRYNDVQVTWAYNGIDALKLIKSTSYDAIVLDIKLPDLDGYEVCEMSRNYTSAPIIMLSNYTDFESRILGLNKGADDYICKPFSFDELKIRIDLRMIRRIEERPAQKLTFLDLTIDTGSLKVSYKNKNAQFTVIEFSILELLARQPDRIFSYEQIYACVWKEPINAAKHTLQARVAELRIKLNTLCDGINYIETVRSKGYRFNASPCEHSDIQNEQTPLL